MIFIDDFVLKGLNMFLWSVFVGFAMGALALFLSGSFFIAGLAFLFAFFIMIV